MFEPHELQKIIRTEDYKEIEKECSKHIICLLTFSLIFLQDFTEWYIVIIVA